ncbi:MAG: flagellar motor switch protein FliM [Bacteroidetes bacterium]|nr:flagellar motor switch protein FliM [Rhodothermia bacterium]MCX7906805.1 flagellar motor switch protein FliM [Bacteroidota bacterium]MDW8285214.1 flagellar motor switch protein FliM [Bacteroidota bacterium]
MKKILSQEEIDTLLSHVGSTGEYDEAALVEERSVELFNFKRPHLISYDQQRALKRIHENFARNMSVYLSAQLRTIVDFQLTGIDQVLYSEYVMSVSPPSALYILEIPEHRSKAVFELGTELCIFVVEKLFGGQSREFGAKRPLSQIEQRIMLKIIGRAIEELQLAWQPLAEFKIRYGGFEADPEFVQIVPGSTPAVVVLFGVRIYEALSVAGICYPYLLLEELLKKSSIEQWFQPTDDIPLDVRRFYEQNVKRSEAVLTVELGRTRLTLEEILSLQVGDVIALERRVQEPALLYIDNKPKFWVQPGVVRGKYRGVKVLDVYHELMDKETAHARVVEPPTSGA